MAYFALLLAMLVSSGNFLFGNLAVSEVPPASLAFWRCLIATICVLPFVVVQGGQPIRYFRKHLLQVVLLSIVGVVICPWLVYLALQSKDLIELGAGYTSIPLLTLLLSALLLNERLNSLQYVGVLVALAGALIFAFSGRLDNMLEFNFHIAFLLMIASNTFRALYLVLLKKWKLYPRPQDGLFAIFATGTLILLPVFAYNEVNAPSMLVYSPEVWGSILFVGVGMGAAYLHLLNYGTAKVGASQAALFSYLVPVFVTIESIIFLGDKLEAFQVVGGLLIVCGVVIAVQLSKRMSPPRPEVE